MAEAKKKGFLALAEAFTIMAKYNDKPYAVCAEHDIIYAQAFSKDLSSDDKERLEELGWHEDEEFDSCMAMFT